MARRAFLYLYMLRVPALVLLALGVVLPATFGTSMFRGIADLELNQIAVVSLSAFLLFSATMTCSFLVLLYGSERADGKRQPVAPMLQSAALPQKPPLSGWIVGALYLIGGFFYLRFLYAVFQTMKTARTHPQGLSGSFLGWAVLGALLGAAIVLVVFVLDLWISSPRAVPQIEVFGLPIVYLFRDLTWVQNILTRLSASEPSGKQSLKALIQTWKRFAVFLVRVLGPGYGRFDGNGKPVDISPGHEFAGMLEVLCFVLYLLAGAGGHRRLYTDAPFGVPRPWDAVLLQVILLLLLACWALSGVSFYFDRYRVPVLLPLGLFLFSTSQLGSSDHAFHTMDREKNESIVLPTPEARFVAGPDHVIAIAAAGGGIQAAAWTSQVLCGLRADIGPPFDRSVLVISGVSGGSVGTMFYLRCLESPRGDTSAAVAATNSSLEAIAWGLAHPDLEHAIFPTQGLFWAGDDRGWALERALRKNAQFQSPDRPLASGNAVAHWPILLFNSTEVRTGDPIVFTNSEFLADASVDKQNHTLRNFHHIYGGRDVNLETAVRMSAAFPYVSPAARADTPPMAEHLADGGYFDNSGIFSLGEWMKVATANGALDAQGHPKNILIIQIDAFPDGQQKDSADKPKSWAYQLIAPILTVLHVRSEGQIVRDTTESSDLIRVMSSHGYDAKSLVARYLPGAGTAGGSDSISCPSDPPLTWHLTEVDEVCIQESWNQIKGNLETELRNFLDSPVKTIDCLGERREARTAQLRPGLYLTEMVKQ